MNFLKLLNLAKINLEKYEGREQSLAKHLVLENYLEGLAVKTLMSNYTEFAFVDAFSGPWNTQDDNFSDTSPAISLRVLKKISNIVSAKKGKEPKVTCIFCERDLSKIEKIHKIIASAKLPKTFTVNVIHGEFLKSIDEIITLVPKPAFKMCFIDPTGWTGLEMRSIQPLISLPNSEVLINFMYEFVNRFINHPNEAIREGIAGLSGSMFTNLDDDQRESKIIDHYRNALSKICGYKFTPAAQILEPKVNRTLFYLIFGTNHSKGLELFRGSQHRMATEYSWIRQRARDRAIEERTKQDSLFGEDEQKVVGRATYDSWVAEQKLDARAYIIQESTKPWTSSFSRVAESIMNRFALKETHVKDLIVEISREGYVDNTWSHGRRKKPKGDDLISYIPK